MCKSSHDKPASSPSAEKTSLANWLDCQPRKPCPYTFQVIEVSEHSPICPEVRKYIADLFVWARISPELLQNATQRFGWRRVSTSLIKPSQPVSTRAQRAEFGEVLMSALLVEFLGYNVPVPKLRFAITGGQSLPGTDTIAIKQRKADRRLSEVCFVETKLRTIVDTGAAVQAYQQLLEDYSQRIPHMIRFVAERLLERGDPLFEDFLSYMFDRSDTISRETFIVGLVWEKDAWTEGTLKNLEDEIEDTQQPATTVNIVRVVGLRLLTDEIFQSIGVGEIRDDE